MRAGDARRAVLLIALAAIAGCTGEGTGPAARAVELRVFSGNDQFGVPAQQLADPFEVRVLDAGTAAPADGVAVEWRVTAGTGGIITVIDATTDEFGVARARLRVGADTGAYAVEARAERQTNSPARFEVRAIRAPQLDAAPALVAAAGTTIELTGSNFHASAAQNVVRFGGVRGVVTGGSATRLEVRVPTCIASRATGVFVEVGGVRSNAITVQGSGPGGQAPAQLSVGEARRYADPASFACLRLAGEPDAEYLLILQNAADRAQPPSPFELVGFADPLAHTAALSGAPAFAEPADRGSSFELSLRAEEAAWAGAGPAPADRVQAALAAIANTPAVGTRTEFRVLKRDRSSTTVTAEVRLVSERAVLYVDTRAPAGGFTPADLQQLGTLFDDPIHATATAVFGQPSDIDGNGRVIILFTPAVNELTSAGDEGFIAGYFYGCDLMERSRCSASNRAEIFYSIVPDPAGTFGRRHSASEVMRSVPAVLAHEFQHMIHFAQKGSTLDALWLSEGLAHAAEDVVADVLAARQQHLLAADFRASNFLRARFYLLNPGAGGLVGEVAPGTLAMRGGAWLLMKYLMGHHGGTEVLGALTRTSQSGVPNIEARVGRTWPELLADFTVALYADGTGLPVTARHVFPNFAPRVSLALSGAYPLSIGTLSTPGFAREITLGASGTDYVRVRVPAAGGQPVHVTLTGLRGGALAAGVQPQLTVLRTR